MSSGAVFQLISNDGKADKMILATDLLEQRINSIRQQNRQRVLGAGGDPEKEDLEPQLAQIQETHLIHFAARFRPYVCCAIEYQKVTPQSGSAQFGNQVIFSLPQFGDFFLDMALNISLSTASAASGVLPAMPADSALIAAANNQVDATMTLLDGSVLHAIDADAKVVRQFDYLGYFRPDGKLLNAGESVSDNVFYCDFPGERMVKTVKFEVNGNPLDDYNTYNYVFDRQFTLKKDKEDGYFRNVGQERAMQGKSVPIADGLRYGSQIFNGLQTPKQVQPEWQVWQKLLFWFNGDFANALPSAAIPFGQRFIVVQLEEAKSLLFRAPACHLLCKIINRFTPTAAFTKNLDGTFDLSGGLAVRNTWYEYEYLPTFTNGALNYPTIKSMVLYANNLFTHPMIHDLYIKRIGFSLVRVHKNQQQTINKADTDMLMNQFKYPVEQIYVGVIPDENISGAYQASDWCQFAKINHKFTKNGLYLTTEANKLFDNTVHHWQERVPTVDSMEVTAHGMPLYQKLTSQFYSSYVPMVFGDHTLVTPADDGALLINFALYPLAYQPSGSLNVSRAREFYIRLYSSVIGAPGSTGVIQSGQMIAAARAINFLLISDGSAVLRYST